MNNLGRRLGVSETWFALLHDKAHGTAQTTFLASIEGTIDECLFKKTLKYLSERYPQLCSRLTLTKTGYFFVNDVKFEKIPIDFLKYQNDNEWQNVMQHEANSILPQDQYLWRAILLSPEHQTDQVHHIIITIHHSIFDGLSSVALINSMLAYLNNTSISVDIRSIPDPIESIYAHNAENNKEIKGRLDKLDNIERYRWPHQKQTILSKRETHFKFEHFLPEQISQLRQVCKQHNISLNAMLNSAMLLSAQKLLGQSFNGGLSTPVSLRSSSNNKVNEEDIGFYVVAINTVHPDISADTDFWLLASEYQQQLKNRLNFVTLPDNNYDFKTLEKSLEFLWDPNRAYFCYDLMVTNLGILNFPHESKQYQIKAVRFGTCRHTGDNNMMLLVDSTRDGMFCTFGYAYPLISDEWAEQFVENVKSYIAI